MMSNPHHRILRSSIMLHSSRFAKLVLRNDRTGSRSFDDVVESTISRVSGSAIRFSERVLETSAVQVADL